MGVTAAAKKKKKNKKKANGSAQAGAGSAELNGAKDVDVAEEEEEDDQGEEVATTPASESAPGKSDEREPPVRNGSHAPAQHDPHSEERDAAQPTDNTTAARLDAMQQERDSLREEVTQLRKSLESLQEKHSDEVSGVREELEQSQQGKEHAETQYRNLLGKVSTIRSQLGERLKADAAELEQARERIEDLENSNKTALEENGRLQESVTNLTSEMESQSSEIESLRSRTNASTSNWVKERDDLVSQQAYIREEYEVAKQAMQDWEILATEERSRREALSERTQELEEQLQSAREAYERLKDESETQSSTVDGLQRAMRDIQEERKRELRETVEQSQAQLEALRTQTKNAEDAAAGLKSQLENTNRELERAAPFEKEVKEKNLLIGKLRHEAVILNDHLTKALRFLKRGKPEDNVDRQLVTNHFLHFLGLERSDPKKFQILQLIAALLGWDEQQREQAGLLRQGTGFSATGGSLRVPMSPFRRTPSTPSLSGEFSPISPAGETRESLAELWSEFLEREAESGDAKAGGSSRRGSVMSGSGRSGMTSPSIRMPEPRRKDSPKSGGGDAG